MTNIFNTYCFMDLLKDYNYVPEADRSETAVSQDFTKLVTSFSNFIKNKTTDYDFMDLLGDNGYVPVNDNWVKSKSDDIIVEIAS